ncbi:ArpU family phage transcriptional regulator [Bacillus cereus str. Schrouff]|uniref:ArpU family phage packaging/lysis transcriptional regulator n=1 Tax=Bacillus cereus TaxID=1396 RepID=UPI000330D5A9|nr:ArpU family phage packaging/lysis transcriptional regulator [Bacillus cereus]EOO05012.1 ArpU family phage transcriptional regulator [Bacillus cereus str. Schrouff]EOO81654.1 ArpU family phage transcriptional regulator [Bacillus cereus K-5975c]
MATCSEVFKNEEFDFSNEPVVNRKKTMRKVLKALTEYRKCKRELSELDKRRVEKAIQNDAYEDLTGTKIYRQYKNIWKLEHALKNALNEFEREIIEEGYLTKEKHNWVRMTMKLKVSKTTYYKGRREAFSRLAHALEIVVYD